MNKVPAGFNTAGGDFSLSITVMTTENQALDCFIR